jgi:hypothetical protein
MSNRKFTLSHCEDQQQFDRSMRRWTSKFRQRFPEFALVIPEQFRQFDEQVFG